MKKAIVIGATSGIGEGIARVLAENGYVVGITGRRIDLLDKIKAEKNNSFISKYFDITHLQNNYKILDQLAFELGGLDLLILSSGTGDLNEDLDFTIEEATIHTNVLGFTCVADWAMKYFIEQKYGHFLGISSIAGIRGSRQAPAYNASKAYQINYLEGLRQKVAKLNFPIFITDLRPGFVATNMAKGEGQFWVATVQKASKQIWSAIKKRKKIAYVTNRWRLIALILKLIPRPIYDLL